MRNCYFFSWWLLLNASRSITFLFLWSSPNKFLYCVSDTTRVFKVFQIPRNSHWVSSRSSKLLAGMLIFQLPEFLGVLGPAKLSFLFNYNLAKMSTESWVSHFVLKVLVVLVLTTCGCVAKHGDAPVAFGREERAAASPKIETRQFHSLCFLAKRCDPPVSHCWVLCQELRNANSSALELAPCRIS